MNWCSPTRCVQAIRDVGGRPRRVFAGDVSPRALAQDAERLGRVLSRALAAFDYEPEPAELVTAFFDGKSRTLYRSTFLDAVVDKLLAWWLAELAEPALSPRLFSYRAGHSTHRALREFGAFVRRHVTTTPNPRERGLYVLRRDVESYGERMPVHEGGPLDGMLARLLEPAVIADRRPAALVFVRRFVARSARREDGTVAATEFGTATGSALQPVLNNLYLAELDARLGSEPAFYTRFGDDVLFASASLDVVTRAAEVSVKVLRELGLEWKASKSLDLWFNAAGRAHPIDARWRAAATFDWLGADLAFDGTRRLRRDKWRETVRRLVRRLERTSRALETADVHARACALLAVLDKALDTRFVASDVSTAELLVHVTSRSQLAELDALLELRIAELATRTRGVRAFRAMPRARLRKLGYVPVVVRHDRAHRRGDDVEAPP